MIALANITLGYVNGEWHGPKPPGDGRGWSPLPDGPQGGKRWRHIGGGRANTPTSGGQARPTSGSSAYGKPSQQQGAPPLASEPKAEPEPVIQATQASPAVGAVPPPLPIQPPPLTPEQEAVKTVFDKYAKLGQVRQARFAEGLPTVSTIASTRDHQLTTAEHHVVAQSHARAGAYYKQVGREDLAGANFAAARHHNTAAQAKERATQGAPSPLPPPRPAQAPSRPRPDQIPLPSPRPAQPPIRPHPSQPSPPTIPPPVAPLPAPPPAPPPPPVQPISQPKQPVLSPIKSKMYAGLRESKLSDAGRREHADAIRMVHDSMPEKARKHLEQIEHIRFYDTSKAASDGVAEWAAERGLSEIAAKYRSKPPKSLGGININGSRVLVDGVEQMPEQYGEYKEGGMKARGLLAHELTHTLDFIAGQVLPHSSRSQVHSQTPEWQNAFSKDIHFSDKYIDEQIDKKVPASKIQPRLTSYASSSPSEGFAEFGRLLYGSDASHEEIRTQFPNASAFFEKLGFWPNPRGPAMALPSGRSGRLLPEMFGERVMLGIDDRSHVDCLLEEGGQTAPTRPVNPQNDSEFLDYEAGPGAVALALWANQVHHDCLLECGGDVTAAFHAAGYILATQSPPEQFILSATRLLQPALSTDAQGHEHRGRGPGGGEFTNKGGGGGSGGKLDDVISGKRKPTADEYGELLEQGYEWTGRGFTKPEVKKPEASEDVAPEVHTEALKQLTPKAKALIQSAHDWENTKPWNTPASGPFPPGFAPTKKEHGEEAHFADGTIWLSSKFFQPPMSNHEEARRHIVYHELGHQLADTMVGDSTSFQLHDARVIPEKHDMGSGTGGGHGDEEAIADTYALLHSDPKWVEARYPKLVKIVTDRAKALGMPLPQPLSAPLAFDPDQPRDVAGKWTDDPNAAVPPPEGPTNLDAQTDQPRASKRGTSPHRRGAWRDQFYSDDDGEWRVGDIADYMDREEIPLISVAVDFLAENNLQVRSGDRGVEKPGDPEFVEAAEATDLSHPIMAVRYPGGVWICDGVHRLWKARARGMTSVEVRLITKGELNSVPHNDPEVRDASDEDDVGLSLEDVEEIHAALAARTPRTVGEPFQGPSGRWFVVKEMPSGNKRVVPAKNPNAAAKQPRGRRAAKVEPMPSKQPQPGGGVGGRTGPPPGPSPPPAQPPAPIPKVGVKQVRANSQVIAQQVIAKLTSDSSNVTAADLQELAENISALTVPQLRQARQALGASFGGGKRQAEMVAALRDHVRSLNPSQKPPPADSSQPPQQPVTPPPKDKEELVPPEPTPPPVEVAPPPVEVAPPPPPKPIGPKAGELFMPDRPLADRLAAYNYGDEVVAKLAGSGEHLKAAQHRIRAANTARDEASSALSRARHERSAAGIKREGKARYKELDAVIKEASKRLDVADREWLAARDDINAAAKRGTDAVRNVLQVPDAHELGGVIDYPQEPQPLHADQKKALADGRAWLVGMVAKGMSDGILPPIAHVAINPLIAGRRGSSRYEQGFLGSANILRMDRVSGTHIAVHEYGHYLDHNIPGAKEVAQEFLRHRVGNETPVSLRDTFPDRGYGKGEYGRKDNFDRLFGDTSSAYYAGKDYPGGYTELVSMGIEQLYKDAAGFAQKDPEYCKFIVGVLHGHLRGGPKP